MWRNTSISEENTQYLSANHQPCGIDVVMTWNYNNNHTIKKKYMYTAYSNCQWSSILLQSDHHQKATLNLQLLPFRGCISIPPRCRRQLVPTPMPDNLRFWGWTIFWLVEKVHFGTSLCLGCERMVAPMCTPVTMDCVLKILRVGMVDPKCFWSHPEKIIEGKFGCSISKNWMLTWRVVVETYGWWRHWFWTKFATQLSLQDLYPSQKVLYLQCNR